MEGGERSSRPCAERCHLRRVPAGWGQGIDGSTRRAERRTRLRRAAGRDQNRPALHHPLRVRTRSGGEPIEAAESGIVALQLQLAVDGLERERHERTEPRNAVIEAVERGGRANPQTHRPRTLDEPVWVVGNTERAVVVARRLAAAPDSRSRTGAYDERIRVIGVGSEEGIQIGYRFSGPSCLDEHTGASQPGGIEPRVEAKRGCEVREGGGDLMVRSVELAAGKISSRFARVSENRPTGRGDLLVQVTVRPHGRCGEHDEGSREKRADARARCRPRVADGHSHRVGGNAVAGEDDGIVAAVVRVTS